MAGIGNQPGSFAQLPIAAGPASFSRSAARGLVAPTRALPHHLPANVFDMRGRELGLDGQDLMLYQMGEVVQIGVMIEKSLDKWISDAYLHVGIPSGFRETPMALAAKIGLARKLAKSLPFHLDDEKEWIREAFRDTLTAMQLRNRVVHDQWLAVGDGKLTRFGYFPPRDGYPEMEIEPGRGPGQFTHEQWEDLRTLLWHCHWRLSHLTWVQRMPPVYDYFFGDPEMHYAMIRGEFYLGRDYLVPWSWADNPPDFSQG